MIPTKIGVVTPVGPVSDNLERTIRSVAAQTYSPLVHVLVFDGFTPAPLDASVHAIVLPKPTGDTGATPRAIGSNYALALGCDALAFLDADNSWDADHLQSLARLAENFEVTFSRRRICNDADMFMFEDYCDSTGESFVDTNCFLLTGKATQVARQWGNVPRAPGLVTAGVDRFLWNRLQRRNLKFGGTGRATVTYRSRWLLHFEAFPQLRPEKCKSLVIRNGIPTAIWIDTKRLSESK